MNTNTPDTIEHGPFTWTRKEREGSPWEAWELTHIGGKPRHDLKVIGLTSFAIKDYGSDTKSEFKLVSGGPFEAAGTYDNLTDAVHGITPYVVEHYTRIAADKRAEANRILAEIANFQPKLTLAMPAGAGKSGWSPCG